MKPMSPGLHLALAQWVWQGGTLIYVGADTDPFHKAHDWWNQSTPRFDSPADHLFETLGLAKKPDSGTYALKKGHVIVQRCHPAFFARSTENAEQLRRLVAQGIEAAGGKVTQCNYIRLRRGPYVIAAVLDESVNDQPLQIAGNFVDLLDPTLAVRHDPHVQPGQQAWLLDLSRVSGSRPLLLAAAGRVESWNVEKGKLEYTISSPEGILVSTRIILDQAPQSVRVNGEPCATTEWDKASHTLLVRHAGTTEPVTVDIE